MKEISFIYNISNEIELFYEYKLISFRISKIKHKHSVFYNIQEKQQNEDNMYFYNATFADILYRNNEIISFVENFFTLEAELALLMLAHHIFVKFLRLQF